MSTSRTPVGADLAVTVGLLLVEALVGGWAVLALTLPYVDPQAVETSGERTRHFLAAGACSLVLLLITVAAARSRMWVTATVQGLLVLVPLLLVGSHHPPRAVAPDPAPAVSYSCGGGGPACG